MDKVLIVGFGSVGAMYEIQKGAKYDSSEIERVINFSKKNYSSKYIGAYMMEDGTKVLETVQVFDLTVGVDNLFKGSAYTEESIYETSIISKVCIADTTDYFLYRQMCDLLDSINEPCTGFTLEVIGCKINMLVCMGGVYHKNPYRKNKCIH